MRQFHVVLYANVTRRSYQSVHSFTRDTATVINIRCCLDDFQVARTHAARRIKENTLLKVDFGEDCGAGGAAQRGVCWFWSI